MHRAVFMFALAAVTNAGISCSKRNSDFTVQKGYITTWLCDQMPMPNQMQWEVTNPFGWLISTYACAGGNSCTGPPGPYTDLCQPEGTIRNHRLRNATVSTISCPDFPCCMRIECSTGNNGDCTNMGFKAVFTNPLSTQATSYDSYLEANYTTEAAAAV
jgi:hypothetical protein